MCVPVNIGFGKTALVPARIEYRTWQMCVCQRKHTMTTCGISVARTWFPSEESATDTGPWMLNGSWCPGLPTWIRRNRRECYVPLDSWRSCLTGHSILSGMFIHWNRNIRDIMRSHISRWIVETVKEAYTQADRDYDHVTAHEVRALSASSAYNCQVTLPDILSAEFWRSSGFFQNSFLRDMACIADGMSTLGPVVVAQQVVDPGHLHPPP